MSFTEQQRKERDYQQLHGEWLSTMMDPPEMDPQEDFHEPTFGEILQDLGEGSPTPVAPECWTGCDDPQCPYTH
jgi:hypothetical protein